MGKLFTPCDLAKFNYLSYPVMSPDGKQIAYVVTHAREEDGAFISVIRIYNVESGSNICITKPGISQKQPAFLNDHMIACLSDESGEDQVWICNLTSGEWQKLSSLRHGIHHYAFSPDASAIAFEATIWPEDIETGKAFLEMSDEEKTAWKKDLDMRPYFITDLTYKMDEWYGMRKGEYSHIGTIDCLTLDAHLIETGEMETIRPAWNSSGEMLAFYGYPYHGPKGRMPELFCCQKDGEGLKQLTSGLVVDTSSPPLFLKDDRRILYAAYPELKDGGTSLLPFAAEIETGQFFPLMDAEDEDVCHGLNPVVSSRTTQGEFPSCFYLSESGRDLHFLTAWQGETRICKIPVDGNGKAELVLRGQTDITGFSLGIHAKPVCIMGNFSTPGELWYENTVLTDHNGWLREYDLPEVESFHCRSRDGKADLQYFLVHPVSEISGKCSPAVLDIKGGPTTMYASAYWHEFHALAAQGFAVICGNPRGSVGFGHAFCSNGICWKNEAMHDLIDMVEDAASRGFVCREQLGVTGGSYGGYMTNKLIGRTNLFQAAVTQRCLVNPAVSYGTGDMGFINYDGLPKDFSMLTYLEDRARGNPLTYIDNIRIPVLILHGFRDYRCGFEQAEQLFIAMKDRHPEIPVRLVMFPEENHSLTRTGKLHSQIRHLQELTDWFVKYLKEDAFHE